MKTRHYVAALLLSTVMTAGCTELQSSAGRVLENAGSVIRTGEKKLWVPNTPQKHQENQQSTEEKKEDSRNVRERY